MDCRSVLLILTYIFSCIGVSFTEDIFGKWEDPHDIFGRSESICGTQFSECQNDLKSCRDELYSIRENNQCKGPRVVKQPSVADHYLKRFVNVLLGSADFKHRKLGEGSEMRVLMNVYFNSKTLPVLQAFASDDTNGFTWADLDESFVKIFGGGDPEFALKYGNADVNAKTFGKSSYPSHANHLTILIFVISSVGFTIMWVYLTGKSIKSATFVGCILVVSICFGWSWWSEVQNQKLKFTVALSRMNSNEVPESCKDHDDWFAWVPFVKSSREDDCLSKMQALHIDPMVAVDMSKVFTNTMQTLAFSWIPALARSCSSAIDEIFGSSTVFGWLGGGISRLLIGPFIIALICVLIIVYFFTRSVSLVKIPSFNRRIPQMTSAPLQEPGTFDSFSPRKEIQYNRSEQKMPKALTAPQYLDDQKQEENHDVHHPWLARFKPFPMKKRRNRKPATRQSVGAISPQQEDKHFRNIRRTMSSVEKPNVTIN